MMELDIETTSTKDVDAGPLAWAEPRRIAVVIAYAGVGVALVGAARAPTH